MIARSQGKKIVETANKTQASQQSAQNKHAVSNPTSFQGVYPIIPGQGNPGGFPIPFPIKYPVLHHGDLDGSRAIDIDLNRFRSHITKFRLTGNVTITITNPPLVTEGMLFFVEVEQDGVGSRTITWPAAVVGNPQPATTPNSKTLIMLFTADKGTKYHSQIFGVSGGGGAGEVFTWSANHSANQKNLTDLNEINFKSTLNSLSIKRSGTAPGYNTLEYDSVQAHDFYVNRSFTLIPRMGVTETSLESNVKLVMNDKDIEKVKTIQFNAIGSVLPGTKEFVGTGEGLVMNITSGKKFKIVAGSELTTKLLELDDLTKNLSTQNVHVTVQNGKIFSVQDTVPTRSLQIFHLFGEQYINAANVLNIQVGNNDRVKIDSRFRLAAGIDLDLSDNDIANIKTVQIKELIPAGSAPTGITDTAILFCRPNSTTGKTELRVKFATGTSVSLADEP